MGAGPSRWLATAGRRDGGTAGQFVGGFTIRSGNARSGLRLLESPVEVRATRSPSRYLAVSLSIGEG